MTNIIKPAPVYRASAIPIVLQIARERSVNRNMRTKKALSEAIGMTYLRLTGIEDGTSRISLDEALHWCEVCEDSVAWQVILHMYGCDRPPTDPRLVSKIEVQLVNYIDQALKAIKAAHRLLEITTDMRPGHRMSDSNRREAKELLGQIDDTHQAAACVTESAEINWGIPQAEIIDAWTSEAIHDDVAIKSIDRFIMIEKEKELV